MALTPHHGEQLVDVKLEQVKGLNHPTLSLALSMGHAKAMS
jgi:hypothetical protein